MSVELLSTTDSVPEDPLVLLRKPLLEPMSALVSDGVSASESTPASDAEADSVYEAAWSLSAGFTGTEQAGDNRQARKTMVASIRTVSIVHIFNCPVAVVHKNDRRDLHPE